ncbi:MAG: LptF/LptG family permease [Phycisphaerae bacterium]|nr:LptF/LptG family permease [Phycisphaerae bacterium]
MNKTLFRYISLDLLKAAGLTLVVLTLTLTTLGIIEPLRKEGLDASQALLVFVVTLPVMLSFTLPFAALFAACFVYGRFSQDNELLASRASGISTITILLPALVLGIAVTLASLSLSNYIAPAMARKGTEAITNNVRGLMCRKLAVRGFLGFQDMTIHADRVYRYPDEDYDKLQGVVVVKRTAKSGHVEIMAAKSARARFGLNHATHRAFVNLTLDEPVLMSSDDPSVRTERTASIDSVSFDRRIKEKPAWYSVNELLATLADPSMSITVQQAIPRIQQAICNDIFARHITRAFQTAGGYDKFISHNERYIITAPKVSVGGSGRIVLGAGGLDNAQLVVITEIRNGKPAKRATATSGEIKITWDKFTKKPEISITLDKDVRTRDLTAPGDDPAVIGAETTRKAWRRGQIIIPKEIRARIDEVTPHEAYNNGGRGGGLTDNPTIHEELDLLNNKHVVQLRRDIKSEIHMRLAFSLSCLLMVMLGGVLGLIFRGGQFVSALVTAILPAATVIATILMGKNIARNPDVLFDNSPDASIFVGLTIIWGGITILAIVTGLTYWRLSRK